MLTKILILAALTLIPTLELRYSIPHGWFFYDEELSAVTVVTVCILANIALAPLVWVFLDKVVHLFLRIDWIARLYDRIVMRSREKIRPYLEKWGTLGLALFIGVPLPGSGVYSGALGAYVLGFTFRQFLVASFLGVMIAGAAVTAVLATGSTAFSVFLKQH